MIVIHSYMDFALLAQFVCDMAQSSKPNTSGCEANASIRPLPIGVVPIAGESLLSMISRAAHDNIYENLGEFLKFAGIDVFRPSYIQFTQMHRASEIAKLLSITERDVVSRLHPKIDNGLIDWYGTPLRRRYVESKLRRIAPGGFGTPFHHRAIWMISALPYCPNTMQLLISNCPTCNALLAWKSTLGLWRCEHCGRSLRHHRSGEVSWNLRADAAAAAQVISTNPIERVHALSQLPAPFSAWEGGDAFEAIVELGAISSRPNDPKLARDLRSGDFSKMEPLDIVNGYRIIKEWPNSFVSLVRNIVEQNTTEGERVRNPALGPLQRFLAPRSRVTQLQRLLVSAIPEAFAEMSLPTRRFSHSNVFRGTPIKARRKRPPGTPVPEGYLARASASRLLHIPQKVLRRLDDNGACVFRPGNSRRAVPYYDAKMLTASAAAYKRGLSPRDVGSRIGVPEFVVPAVCQACSVVEISDQDAVRLSGVPALYEPTIIDEFVKRLREPNVGAKGGSISVVDALSGRRLEPNARAALISSILSGSVSIRAPARAGTPPISHIGVDPAEAKAILDDVPVHIPKGITVSGTLAAELLGHGHFVISNLVEAGIIKAHPDSKRHPKISLEELAAFKNNYLTSREAARLLGLWPDDATLKAQHPAVVGHAVADKMAEFSIEPIRTRYKGWMIWRRIDVEAAFNRALPHSAIRTLTKAQIANTMLEAAAVHQPQPPAT